MISYRDRTYCVSDGCTNKCGRKFTQEIHQAAIRWWGSEDAPISVSRFCDENGEIIHAES